MSRLAEVLRQNAIALLALFVALGGTSWAATVIARNSVGTRQLRNGAVTGAKIRPHSLPATVMAPGVLGSTTPPGIQTTVVVNAQGPSACGSNCGPAPAGTTSTVTESCPAGFVATGGGYDDLENGSSGIVTASQPMANDGGWEISYTLTQAAGNFVGNVYAVCAKA